MPRATEPTACRHLIRGVIWPAQTNCDDSHDWVERCDTCRIYDNDDEAARAVVAFYAPHGVAMCLGYARPFGVDADCPYVTPQWNRSRPAIPPAVAIARLEAAGWRDVAADLRDGVPARHVLAELADDPDRHEAAFVVNRIAGGWFDVFSARQRAAAYAAYALLAHTLDAAVWPRNVCLGVYHGPDASPDRELVA